MSTKQFQYPWAPLEQHFDGNLSALARQTGIHRTMLNRAKAANSIPETLADRIALKMGLHPAIIWPDIYEEHAHGDDLVSVG